MEQLISSSIILIILNRIDLCYTGCGCKPGYSAPISSSDNELFEGDLKLSARDVLSMSRFRNLISRQYRWPNGVIPYKLTHPIFTRQPWDIKSALKKLSDATGGCVKFREATDVDANYVKVVCKCGCYSSLGMTGGEQELSLGKQCDTENTIQHEFIHALGFGHEQARPDRDKHVTIHWDNIESAFCDNFKIMGQLPKHPYDIHSIMHYESHFFHCDRNRPTISSKDGRKVGGKSLTKLDIAKIKSFYDC